MFMLYRVATGLPNRKTAHKNSTSCCAGNSRGLPSSLNVTRAQQSQMNARLSVEVEKKATDIINKELFFALLLYSAFNIKYKESVCRAIDDTNHTNDSRASVGRVFQRPESSAGESTIPNSCTLYLIKLASIRRP